MNFRQAQPSDAELLAQLRINMRRERETLPPPDDEAAFLEENINYFRNALNTESYIGFIAFEDNTVAGTGGICLHIHPPSYGVPNGKTACLLNMYTLPGARGKGVAGKILSLLIEKAKEKECCKIYLNASNMGKPLYQKNGFTDVENEMVLDIK
ncbi:MAG: GNAT family N-acetyltransferase [Lentisphaeria bacterium]|nr:GNAT family N-acetyltransferase [Lentisphaeria bacterium]